MSVDLKEAEYALERLKHRIKSSSEHRGDYEELLWLGQELWKQVHALTAANQTAVRDRSRVQVENEALKARLAQIEGQKG